MQEYYIDGLEDRKKYLGFLGYMTAYSDAFSLVYFQYTENERQKRSVKQVKKELEPFKIYARNTLEWPGMETMDTRHIYRLAVYRCHMDTLPALEKAHSLWEWDYPKFPMDLAFYRDGYAWFWSVAHEGINSLYTDDLHVVDDLSSLGLQLNPERKMALSNLYYDEKTIHSRPKLG